MKVYKRRRLVVPGNTVEHRRNTLLADVLPANAQEREAHNLQIDEIRNDQVTLPEDLLIKIFMLLPAESLYRMQFVCKEWQSMINCSGFIRCHAQKSETVLICGKQAISLRPFEITFYYHSMDFERRIDNFVESKLVDCHHIFASCDGLVLALTKNSNSLLLTNPVTRKHTELPLSKMDVYDSFSDSYSLAFCKKANTYKIVHLINTICEEHFGCEIMSIFTREWKTIDGLSSDLLQLHEIHTKPVSIAGSLYWMPPRDGCDYLVSLNVDKEKFVTKKLPTVCTKNDRIVETGGFLGLATHAKNHIMEVWILRTGDLKENWIKRYSMKLMNFEDSYPPIAICSPRNGTEMVFLCLPDESLYVSNIDKDESKLVYSTEDIEQWYKDRKHFLSVMNYPGQWYNDGAYITHRNTLMSWENPSS